MPNVKKKKNNLFETVKFVNTSLCVWKRLILNRIISILDSNICNNLTV